MKLRLAALVLFPLLAASAPRTTGPDLRVVDVVSQNLDSGILRVQIHNKGDVTSAPCAMSVSLTGLQTGVTTVPVAAIQPNHTIFVNVSTGKPLSQVHYTVRVDRSNVVHEPDEANNIKSGQFGGKP